MNRQKAIDNFIHQILESPWEGFAFYRSFLPQIKNMGVVTCRMNELLVESPETTDVILCFYLYPVLKWALELKEPNVIMQLFLKNRTNTNTNGKEVERLVKIQKLIQKITERHSHFTIENRNSFFSSCEELVELIESIIEWIFTFPEYGERYNSVLKIFTSNSKTGEGQDIPSAYFINRDIKCAVQLVTDWWGEKLSKNLSKVLTGNIIANDEFESVYHNISLLLKEYYKILWQAKYSTDKALQLLSCNNMEELQEFGANTSQFQQADSIVNYIKFIRGAIEAVKDFPGFGEEYYQILIAITELKSNLLSDSEIAFRLGMCPSTYSFKKRSAISVLEFVLWGTDIDGFLRLLTDKKV